MLRGVLFDFNGVLVDDEPLHCRLLRQVLAEEGVQISDEEYYRDLLGFDDRGAIGAALTGAGREATPAFVARLIARKASYYAAAIERDGFPFFPGAKELVRDCAAAGARLGVVSGALREEIESALDTAGLRASFLTIVAAQDVEASKPDSAGYLQALVALNASPPLPERLLHAHEVLAIEDSPAGIAAARGAGLLVLGVAQTYDAHALAEADAVVDRLSGLTWEALVERFRESGG